MQMLRWLLYPVSLIYGSVTFLRNKLYDWGFFTPYNIPGKSICVGNLSTGGTGKTPHVAYLAALFRDRTDTVILSRGYGRKTSGFLWVSEFSKSFEAGDEPLYYARKFENVKVAVCESRVEGVRRIQREHPLTSLIILDDAFQHRAVKTGFSILLTDHSRPFYRDHMLPTGNLREWRIGKKRADCVIVTKCPKDLDLAARNEIKKSLSFAPEKVFFSRIAYGKPVAFTQERATSVNVLLVTGIANASPLLNHLRQSFHVKHLEYADHYAFTSADIQEIHQKFDTFATEPTIILTTEKDFMRLKDRVKEWKMDQYPWYFQPISIEIDEEEEFKALIDSYVDTV